MPDNPRRHTVAVAVRLTPEMATEAREIAEAKGLPLSTWMRSLLADALINHRGL